MKQKTVMVDPGVWIWLKEHRGAGNISDLIKQLIKDHGSKKTDTQAGARESIQELKQAVGSLQA